MNEFEVRKEIAAPPARVFALASDFPGLPGHVRGIRKVEMLTPGPIAVGTRFRETREMFGREATEEMEVVEFEAPRRFTLACESCGCAFRSDFTVTETPSGSEVVMRLEVVPRTFLAKLMGFLMRPMIKGCLKAMEADLEDVRRAAESGDTGAPDEQARSTTAGTA